MAIRIELDAKALASIIGGDSEVELNLRKQIVCEFTRQHLVKLVHDEAFKSVANEVSSTVRDVLKSEYGVGGNLAIPSLLYSSQSDIRSKIRELISVVVNEEIEKAKSDLCESKNVIRDIITEWTAAQKEEWKTIANRIAYAEIRAEVKRGLLQAIQSATSN